MKQTLLLIAALALPLLAEDTTNSLSCNDAAFEANVASLKDEADKGYPSPVTPTRGL